MNLFISCRQAFHFFHWPPLSTASFIRLSLSPAQAAEALPLSGATKEAKRSFSYRSERTKNHRNLFMCFLVWDKRGETTLLSLPPSVIFSFLLSAYRVLFSAHLYLKLLSIQLTATLLFSQSLSSSDTRCYRYFLPSLCPTVDIR